MDEIFLLEDFKNKYYNINKNASNPPYLRGKDNPSYGKKISESTRLKIKKSLSKIDRRGKNNSFYGKKHTEETLNKMRKTDTKYLLSVYNKNTKEEFFFDLSTRAAEYLNVHNSLVFRRINESYPRYTKSPINKEWFIKKI